MNTKQLAKNVGDRFRLRPKPVRVDGSGKRLPDIDDYWRLDEVLIRPAGIRLVNIRTGHALELEADNIMERRSPDFFLLRCQIFVTPQGIDIEPIQKGSPLIPDVPSMPPKAERKSINIPKGYETRLNYHRYRIARDFAARDPSGRYRYPVRCEGSKSNIDGFIGEVIARLNVNSDQIQADATSVQFEYIGAHGPEVILDLANAHKLKVLQCGNSITM